MRRPSLLTRLALVGLIASLVVLVLGGLAVVRALGDVRASNLDGDRAAAAIDALPLVTALQRERLASVASLIGAETADLTPELVESRLAVDGTREAAADALDALVEDEPRPELLADVEDATGRLEGLDGFRDAVSGGRVGPGDAIGHYTATIQELLDIPGSVGQLLADADVGRRVTATTALHRGTEQVWLQQAQLLPTLGVGGLGLSSTGPLIAATTKQSVELGSYQILATGDQRERLQTLLESGAVGSFNTLRDRILSEESTAGIASERFLITTGDAVDALEEEEALAAEGAAIAFEQWRGSRRGALVRSLVLFALALGVLAVAVLLLARWVAEPVSRFADDADQLASGLPHLLTRAEADPQRTGRPIDALSSPMRGPFDRLASAIDGLVRVALDGAYRRADLRLTNRSTTGAFADALSASAMRQVELLSDLRELEEEPTRIAGLATAEDLGRQMALQATHLSALSAEAAEANARPIGLREIVADGIDATGSGDRVSAALDSATVMGRHATALRALVTALLESALAVGDQPVLIEITPSEGGRLLTVADGGPRPAESASLAQAVLRGESASGSFSLLVASKIAQQLQASARLESLDGDLNRVVVELPKRLFSTTATAKATAKAPQPGDEGATPASATENGRRKGAEAKDRARGRDRQPVQAPAATSPRERRPGPSWSTLASGQAPSSGTRADAPPPPAPVDSTPQPVPQTDVPAELPAWTGKSGASAGGPARANGGARAGGGGDLRSALTALEDLSRTQSGRVEPERAGGVAAARPEGGGPKADVDLLLEAALATSAGDAVDLGAPAPAAVSPSAPTPAPAAPSHRPQVSLAQRAVTVQSLLGAFQDALQDARP